MIENEDEDREISYTVSLAEHRLLVRGLVCLQLTLLDEAGDLATRKLKRRKGTGSMKDVVDAGMARLEQLKLLKKLNKRLLAIE